MSKKIAVPVDDSGMLDAHFGHCKYFAIMTEENAKIVTEEFMVPPPHEPGVLPDWLAKKGVTVIIAGGIGQRAIDLFNQTGVDVLVGVQKLSAKELAESYVDGTLVASANYCDH